MGKKRNSIDFILEASMDPVLGTEFLRAKSVKSLKVLFDNVAYVGLFISHPGSS